MKVAQRQGRRNLRTGHILQGGCHLTQLALKTLNGFQRNFLLNMNRQATCTDELKTEIAKSHSAFWHTNELLDKQIL